MLYDEHFKDSCKKLGSHIKNLREIKKLTVQNISKITGIRAEYIKKIESGKAYGVLIDKHLLKIAKALNVKMSELFDF